jgi:hypothetical protein
VLITVGVDDFKYRSIGLALLEEVLVLDERMSIDIRLAPEVGRVEEVSVLDAVEGGLDEVALGTGLSFGLGVDILDSGELEQLLGDWRSDQTSSTRSGNAPHLNGTTLSGDLAGNGMGVTDLVTPVSLTDGDEAHLSHHQSSLDGALNFLVALPSETDVLLLITNDNVGLEAGTLTGLRLLLDGLDLHNLLLKIGDEGINNLELLHGDGEPEDFVEAGDLASLNEPAQLGDWNPLLSVSLSVPSERLALAVLTLSALSASLTESPTLIASGLLTSLSSSCGSCGSGHD